MSRNWIPQTLLPFFTIVFFAATFLLPNEAVSYVETYVEGEHYQVVSAPGAVDDPSKIEVREFFWYGCPHCYKLEADLEPWIKTLGADVSFVRTPAVMAKPWKLHGKAYYAAENLGIADKAHKAVFKEIHQNKNFLSTEEKLATFYSEFGVSEQDFSDQMNSFGVKTSMRKAEQLAKNYRLTGVPAIIVNGKYQPISKSYSEMLTIVDFLVEKERREMKKK